MITFRRALVMAAAVLTIFFLFFGSSNKISPKDLLHDKDLEQRLLKSKEDTELALKELKQATLENQRIQKEHLEELERERHILERQLAQLRRLPEGASLRTQLAFQFPYYPNERFPAYIWQTWKTDFNDPHFNARLKRSVLTWREKNSNFVHEVLSDATARALVRHLYMNVPDVVTAYDLMPDNILRADFFRYLVLLARGGTYSDVDTEALKPIPNWLPEDTDPLTIGLTIGIEADPDREDWADWYARRIQFCQWTIQSKPGHPVLRDVVANITEQTLARQKAGKIKLPSSSERGSQIMDWTGPGVWTDAVFGYFNDPVKSGLYYPVTVRNFTGMTRPKVISDVLVLPITSFSPGVEQMGSKDIHDEMAFVQHLFEGSWKDDKN